MKLQNTSRATLTHEKIVFKPADIAEIPEKVAKIWLNIEGIKQYVDPVEVEAQEKKAAALLEEANKKIAKLEAEIAELKAKETKTQTKKVIKK